MSKGNFNYKKGKKGSRNGKSNKQSARAHGIGEKGLTINDYKWYVATPEIAKDASSISFNNRTGDIVPSSSYASESIQRVPGIMSIFISSCPGVLISGQSPANIAGNGMLTTILRKLSRISVYQKTDLLMYLLSMASVFNFYAWMIRLYGIIGKFSQKNMYYCEALLRANGVSPALVREGHSLRFYINKFAKKLENMVLPKGFTFFDKQIFMFRDIYLDNPGEKSQIYQFTPEYFWKFTINADSEPELVPASIIAFNTQRTLDDIQNFGDSLIDNISQDSDFITISGDIAYVYNDIWKLAPVSEDYCIEPIYSKEMLMQIHNLCSLDITYDSSIVKSNTIKQATDPNLNDYLVYNPKFVVAPDSDSDLRYAQCCGNRYFDINEEVPSDEDKMVSSRLMWSMDVATVGSKHEYTFNSIGTELVWGLILYHYANNGDLTTVRDFGAVTMVSDNPNAISWNITGLRGIVLREYFDYVPMMTINLKGNQISTPGVYGVMGELNNYTVISKQQIKNLNDAACLGLFNVLSVIRR